MLASNAMRAFQWMSATRFGAIFFLGPDVFLLWRSLYMYYEYHMYMYYVHMYNVHVRTIYRSSYCCEYSSTRTRVYTYLFVGMEAVFAALDTHL